MAEAGAKKIGWIGTGVMGKSMAAHLMAKGHTLYVYTRTASKADELVAAGATFMEPVEIAKQADYIFLMLGFPQDVRDIVLKEGTGILHHMKSGATLVDHTTSSPALAVEIAELGASRGIHSVDAPVSGGDIGAKNGKLVVMVGGTEAGVASVRDLLDIYSLNVQHMGAPGAGQHTKMANQIMIATTMVGLCESLLYAQKANLDHQQMISLLKAGAAGSFSLEKLGPRMLTRDFEPGFYVEHFVKDLGIVLDESRIMNLSVPGTALAYQLYQAMMA